MTRAAQGGGWASAWAALGMLCAAAGSAHAQFPSAAARGSNTNAIQAKADRLDYDRDTGWVEGTGHVIVTRGADEVRADYLKLNTETGEVYARGNVTRREGDSMWSGSELRYNYRTGEGSVAGLGGAVKPYRVQAESVDKGPKETYILHRARVTTCVYDYPHSHYSVRASRMVVVPEDHIKAWNAAWYFGRVPVMYVPFWHRTLRQGFGFRFYPGYSSRMGAFLLLSYKYRLRPGLDAETHTDYRTRRGVAVGQDVRWEGRDWRGEVTGYYIADRRPYPLGLEADPNGAIPDGRHRLTLRHSWEPSPRDYLSLQGEIDSDAFLREDFFEDEYRWNTQPDNYVVYGHQGAGYTAGLLLRGRLNDFYTQVERLPEATFGVVRRPIGDTAFYVETQNAAAYLRKLWADDTAGAEDYDAARIDSLNGIYYPFRVFGFLNLVPRARYRATYYSSTMRHGETTDGALRSLFEIGQEASFSAYRVFNAWGMPLRHIVEPYADWTYIPPPDVRPSHLPQFDEIDTLSKRHEVLLGVRNQLQIKRAGRPYDLADLDINTTWRIWKPAGEDAVRYVNWKADLHPALWLRVESDGTFDAQESALLTMNTRLFITGRDLWRLGFEHRFRRSDSSLYLADCTLLPERTWSFNAYGRYEAEQGRVEETGGYVQRNLDCMSVRTGLNVMPAFTTSAGARQPEEWRIMIEMWVLAFPNTKLGTKYKQ